MDYSDDMFSIRINSNNVITIECHPSSVPLGISGYFLVRDSKGEKQIFNVVYPLSGCEFFPKEYAEKLLDDPDFWRE